MACGESASASTIAGASAGSSGCRRANTRGRRREVPPARELLEAAEHVDSDMEMAVSGGGAIASRRARFAGGRVVEAADWDIEVHERSESRRAESEEDETCAGELCSRLDATEAEPEVEDMEVEVEALGGGANTGAGRTRLEDDVFALPIGADTLRALEPDWSAEEAEAEAENAVLLVMPVPVEHVLVAGTCSSMMLSACASCSRSALTTCSGSPWPWPWSRPTTGPAPLCREFEAATKSPSTCTEACTSAHTGRLGTDGDGAAAELGTTAVAEDDVELELVGVACGRATSWRSRSRESASSRSSCVTRARRGSLSAEERSAASCARKRSEVARSVTSSACRRASLSSRSFWLWMCCSRR